MSYINRPLSHQDYRTPALATLDSTLEFRDFTIFIFFVTVVGELFFLVDTPE